MSRRQTSLNAFLKLSAPLALLAAAIASSACGRPQSPAEAAEPRPTVSAIANSGPTPGAAGSGAASSPAEVLLAALSETTDRVAHEDVAGLVALAKFARITCASAPRVEAACPASSPDGSAAELFPYVACDARYAAESELAEIFTSVFRGRAPELFAVARTHPSASDGAFPLGPYAAVFETTPPFGVSGATGAILALDEGGRILSLRTGCRATPVELYASIPVQAVIIDPQR